MTAASAARAEPRERGIIFTDTVSALLDGTKTQTRRIVKLPAGHTEFYVDPGGTVFGPGPYLKFPATDMQIGHGRIRCPYGYPGDRFYVKERWDYFGGDEYIYQREPGAVLYEAGCDLTQIGRRWRNPMFMPRWAARLRFELTEVRVQRVQEITEEDARAEIGDSLHGVLDDTEICRLAKLAGCMATDTRAWFAAAWDMIHGRGAWERNDHVWALTFKPAAPAEGATR